jgi:glutaredoxin
MLVMPKSKLLLIAALVSSLSAVAHDAVAQYKYVGPDGRVTYSDRPPPPEVTNAKTSRIGTSGAGVAQDADLPFAVKQAAGKYPVTVYTAPDCSPCTAAKAHLQKRGVPFSERVVRNVADTNSFKALGFSELSFPAISIGSQKQSGFEAGGLDTLLDAAGYPKSAKLPASYQAKSEPLTPEPAAKTTVRVAEAGQAEKGADGKAEAKPRRPVREQPAPPKQEPTIRF